MPKKVVILSGGLDSTVLLHKVVKEFGRDNVHAITVNYGQRHSREIECAKWQCSKIGVDVDHVVIDISSINSILAGSALTDSSIDVPNGEPDDAVMKVTFVPNRNMILLAIAIARAASVSANEVYYGAHAGDHAIYPDCRPEFVKKMGEVAAIANYQPIAINAPFSNVDKSEVVKIGKKLGVQFEHTWTCYVGGDRPCGKCGACTERAEAFQKAGINDPLA